MKVDVYERRAADSHYLHVAVAFAPDDVTLTSTPSGVDARLMGGRVTGAIGGPALPATVIRVALPAATRIANVVVRPGPAKRAAARRGVIAPRQPPHRAVPPPGMRPASARGARPVLPAYAAPMAALYEREAGRRRPFAELLGERVTGAQRIAALEIRPVRLAADGGIELVTAGEVILKLEPDHASGKSLGTLGVYGTSQASRLVELVRGAVVNPGAVLVPPIQDHPGPRVDYLILTDNQTWDPILKRPTGQAGGDLVTAFDRLAEWKMARGLAAMVVTVSDVVNGVYGDYSQSLDLQEVLRKFLKWAHSSWGTAWVLIGGDCSIVPVRLVAGGAEGLVDSGPDDPPLPGQSFWTGQFLKMNVEQVHGWGWPGPRREHLLVNLYSGALIPLGSQPTGAFWRFTGPGYDDDRWDPTNFVRVDGSEAEVRSTLKWLYPANMLATDFYYSGLANPYRHRDWDCNGNGIYGQCFEEREFDPVLFVPAVSVGRAPVRTEADVDVFVDRVVAYESFRRSDGSLLDQEWPRKVLMASTNWFDVMRLTTGSANPPAAGHYAANPTQSLTLLHLERVLPNLNWRLRAEMATGETRVFALDWSAAPGRRGWYCARSGTDLSPNVEDGFMYGQPIRAYIPSEWVVVHGEDDEMSPLAFVFNAADQDGSMVSCEALRRQITTELPGVDLFTRLYEDVADLSAAELAAAPVQFLSAAAVRAALEAGQHWVSLVGHGSERGCAGLDDAYAGQIGNGPLAPIVYSLGCNSGQFDSAEAFSEQLLRNPSGGAVAFIGSSRVTTIGLTDAFEYEFFRRLGTTRHLGSLNDSRCDLVDVGDPLDRDLRAWAVFTLNLLGDPEMPVWLGRPAAILVDVPAVVSHDQLLTVIARREVPRPAELGEATVELWQSTGYRRVLHADPWGCATFDVSGVHPGDVRVTVSKIGYIPWQGTVTVT